MQTHTVPYLTPQKVHRNRSLPGRFTLAIMCFRPAIEFFKQYQIELSPEQQNARYFLMLHPSHVMFCSVNSIGFVVLSEIYGGPQTTAILEELASYGISKVIGLSLAGSFKEQLKIGTHFHVGGSLREPGTTPTYDGAELIVTNSPNKYGLRSETVWTTNSLYREYPADVKNAMQKGCSVVNIDSSHFLAAGKKLGMYVTNLCTVSDVLEETGTDLTNSLTETVDGTAELQAALAEKVVNMILPEYAQIESFYQQHQDYLLAKVSELFDEMKVCKSHNIDHIHRVLTHSIGALCHETLPLKTAYLIRFAAILHDADDKKLISIQISKLEQLEQTDEILNQIADLKRGDFPKARQFLKDLMFYSEEDIELVIEMISYVSFASNANTIPSRAVQFPYLLIPRYADRIEALGYIGVLRTLQFSQTVGTPLFVESTAKPVDSSAEAIFELVTDDRLDNYQRLGCSASVIDHFYDKMLHISKGVPTSNAHFKRVLDGANEPFFEFIRAYCEGNLEQHIKEKYNM